MLGRRERRLLDGCETGAALSAGGPLSGLALAQKRGKARLGRRRFSRRLLPGHKATVVLDVTEEDATLLLLEEGKPFRLMEQAPAEGALRRLFPPAADREHATAALPQFRHHPHTGRAAKQIEADQHTLVLARPGDDARVVLLLVKPVVVHRLNIPTEGAQHSHDDRWRLSIGEVLHAAATSRKCS